MEQTLVSRNVSHRRQDQQKRRQSQQFTMDTDRMERNSQDFNQSVFATNDHYMKDALTKVRQSNVTQSETVTRLHGTWMFNKSRLPEIKFGLERDLEEEEYQNHKLLFGNKFILLSTKTLLNGSLLGETIPNEFLFDFSIETDTQFHV
jgi:hypothetical protein